MSSRLGFGAVTRTLRVWTRPPTVRGWRAPTSQRCKSITAVLDWSIDRLLPRGSTKPWMRVRDMGEASPGCSQLTSGSRDLRPGFSARCTHVAAGVPRPDFPAWHWPDFLGCRHRRHPLTTQPRTPRTPAAGRARPQRWNQVGPRPGSTQQRDPRVRANIRPARIIRSGTPGNSCKHLDGGWSHG